MRPLALLASRPMRWPVALGAAAAGLAFAALFFSGGSSQSRLFWIGAAAVLVAAVGWVWRPRRLPLEGTVFFCLLAAFIVWQGVSIAWSIQPSRSWDYTNRGLVYFAFAAVGALLGGVPLRRFAAVACVLLGALFAWALAAKVVAGVVSGLRAAGAAALSPGLLERARVARRGGGAARVVGGGAAARAAGAARRRALVVRGARRRGADVLARRDRVDRRRCARVALARSGRARGARAARRGLGGRRLRRRGGVAASRGQRGRAAAPRAPAGRARVRRGAARRGDRGRALRRSSCWSAPSMRGWPAGRPSRSSSCCLPRSWPRWCRRAGPAISCSARWHEFSNRVSSQVPDTPGRVISTSSSNRWRWWTEAWNAFTANPLRGTGAGTFELTDRLERDTQLATTEPHSVPLQFLSETGIVGFLLYVGVIAAGGDRGAAPGPDARRGWRCHWLWRSASSIPSSTSTGTSSRCWDPLFLTVGALVSGPASRGLRSLVAVGSPRLPWASVRSRRFTRWLRRGSREPRLSLSRCLDERECPAGANGCVVGAGVQSAVGRRALRAGSGRAERQGADPVQEGRRPRAEERGDLVRARLVRADEPAPAARCVPRPESRVHARPQHLRAGTLPGRALDAARCQVDPATCPK